MVWDGNMKGLLKVLIKSIAVAVCFVVITVLTAVLANNKILPANAVFVAFGMTVLSMIIAPVVFYKKLKKPDLRMSLNIKQKFVLMSLLIITVVSLISLIVFSFYSVKNFDARAASIHNMMKFGFYILTGIILTYYSMILKSGKYELAAEKSVTEKDKLNYRQKIKKIGLISFVISLLYTLFQTGIFIYILIVETRLLL